MSETTLCRLTCWAGGRRKDYCGTLASFRPMGKAWIKARKHDRFYRAAKKQSYRSRAAIKLSQIDLRYGLFEAGDVVVDLGAAPGGWSQVARERIGPKGRVLARRAGERFDAVKGVKPTASSATSAEIYVLAVGRL